MKFNPLTLPFSVIPKPDKIEEFGVLTAIPKLRLEAVDSTPIFAVPRKTAFSYPAFKFCHNSGLDSYNSDDDVSIQLILSVFNIKAVVCVFVIVLGTGNFILKFLLELVVPYPTLTESWGISSVLESKSVALVQTFELPMLEAI